MSFLRQYIGAFLLKLRPKMEHNETLAKYKNNQKNKVKNVL